MAKWSTEKRQRFVDLYSAGGADAVQADREFSLMTKKQIWRRVGNMRKDKERRRPRRTSDRNNYTPTPAELRVYCQGLQEKHLREKREVPDVPQVRESVEGE